MLFPAGKAFSQTYLTELTVDRPGIADTPFTVPKGMYQFEIGFDYYRRPTGEFFNLPVAMFRTGIAKGTEFRLSSRNIVDKSDVKYYQGITPLSLGIKTGIIKQKKWIPETDIMANLVIPINANSNQSNKTGYEFLLLFQNDFYPDKALNYNIGYLWDNLRGKSMLTTSVCFNYLPTRRLGLFIEYFSFIPDSWPGEQGMDGGLTFLVIDELQIDFSIGSSVIEGQNIFFASSGISFRISKEKPEESDD